MTQFHIEIFISTMKPYKIFGVVLPGLEHIAEKELRDLGVKNYVRMKGGIEFVGHQSLLILCNLKCRVFSRFLVRFDIFTATTFQELEAKFIKLDWNQILERQNICLHVNSVDSKLYHEKAIGLTVISSLNKWANREIEVDSVPQKENSQLIVVNAYRNKFSISVDSSGEHLHKRGYMDWREKAPLRETIAAAMLSTVSPVSKTLLDPLCGSGTIPIEMAVMAKRLPMSNFRKYAFQDWPTFQRDRFQSTINSLNEEIIDAPNFVITGSDIDEKAIETARHNAKQANVEDIIDWQVKDIKQYSELHNKLIVTNPPYGVRINGTESLKSLVKMAKTNDVYVIHPRSFKQSKELFSIKNGAIRVKFQKLSR